MNAWADYEGKSHKYLSDNRARYIAQSAATPNGVVASLPARFMQPPQPGTLPRPVADGCANFAREYERAEMLDGRFPTTDTYGD